MEIDLIFKIAAVGIVVSILNQVLVRSGREEQATMTSLAALVVVLMIVVQRIAELQKGLPERKRLCQSLGIMGGLFLFLILV